MNTLLALAASLAYSDQHDASVDDDEDDDNETEESEEEEAAPAPKKKAKSGTKKVKKGSKKVEKKETKKSSSSGDKNIVRLKDLAKQAKLTEAVCRKKLRDAEVPRGEGRWSWELGSKALAKARKALDLG